MLLAGMTLQIWDCPCASDFCPARFPAPSAGNPLARPRIACLTLPSAKLTVNDFSSDPKTALAIYQAGPEAVGEVLLEMDVRLTASEQLV